MNITKKEEERILRKQCSMAGVDFKKFFKRYLTGKPMPKDWYRTHTWSVDKEKEFKEWLIKFCMKKFKSITRKYAENMAGFWILDYGWVTK